MTRRLGSGSLVIATHNAGKLKEISALLDPYGVKCLSAGSLGLPEPAETGTTFAQNALIKARAAAEASGLAALADDSGLSVAALDGRPGVYTADWAERQWFEGDAGRDWYMAMGKVEGLLAEQGPDVDRSARFVCTLALAYFGNAKPASSGSVLESAAPAAAPVMAAPSTTASPQPADVKALLDAFKEGLATPTVQIDALTPDQIRALTVTQAGELQRRRRVGKVAELEQALATEPLTVSPQTQSP